MGNNEGCLGSQEYLLPIVGYPCMIQTRSKQVQNSCMGKLAFESHYKPLIRTVLVKLPTKNN
jgi:hypothetical protein